MKCFIFIGLNIFLKKIKMWNLSLISLKRMWGNGENTGYQHFVFFFPHCFVKLYSLKKTVLKRTKKSEAD